MAERTIPWAEEIPEDKLFPLIFRKEAEWSKWWEEWKEKEESKVGLFEKGLAQEINADDSIEVAFKKMVKMALAAEFGAGLVKAKGAAGMIETITSSILVDPELRRQALIIIDRFVRKEKPKPVFERERKKVKKN